MTDTTCIDLSIGGPDWCGFQFSRYGKARNWRIILPDGETMQAAELLGHHQLTLSVDYLRVRLQELEAKMGGLSVNFTAEESRLLRLALQVLQREIPVNRGRGPSQQVSPLQLVSEVVS